MSRQRLMALCFAVGSFGFLIGPFPGYAQLVGSLATAWTFFISSIFFTSGGGIQSWLGWAGRHSSKSGHGSLAGGDHPVGGNRLLQLHHLPRDPHFDVGLSLRPPGVAS